MSSHITWKQVLLLLAAVALWGWGCSSDTRSPTEGGIPSVVQVEVSPAAGTLTELGATLQLSAIARDKSGDAIPGLSFAWSSSDGDIVTVDASGFATAMGSGVATVTAEAAGVVGQTILDVRVPSIQLTDAEAEAISEQLTNAALGSLDFAFGRFFSAATSAAPSAVPVEIKIEFEIARGCPLDGKIIVAGSFMGAFDREEHTGQFELNATKVVDFCRFPRGDVIFTLFTEEPHIVIRAAAVHEGESFRSELHVEGILHIETSDGRAATCEISLWITHSRSEEGSEHHRTDGHVCTKDVGGGDDGGGGEG